MNDTNLNKSEVVKEFRRLFAEAAADDRERAAYSGRAPAAIQRLVAAAYGRDNTQSQIITAWLASIYNGGDSKPVRLDDIRCLDWSLQKDLIDSMIGVGHGGVRDDYIRDAFFEIGGDAAVRWFHRNVPGSGDMETCSG